MYNTLKYIVLIFVSLLFSNCTKVPDGVVSEKTMENILFDSYLGEGLSDTELTTIYEMNAKEIYLKSVLKKYDVSKQEYDASLSWYTEHLDKYAKIYEKVLVRLQKEESKLKLENSDGNTVTDIAKGDSLEMWKKSSHLYFSGLPLIGNIFTEIRANDGFIVGDSLVFKAKIKLFKKSIGQLPRMVLTIGYQDETSKTVVEKLNESKRFSIKIASDSTKRINFIIAGFYHENETYLSLDSVSLKRFHRK
ncbi:MAG: DUF4296 domain-containing protein [Bacteroidales bacterium]